MNKKSVVLLSGGLDSVVSLAAAADMNYNPKLALTFDYGQKSFEREYKSAKAISEYYKLEHKVIKLDWLKEISTSALTGGFDIPCADEKELDDKEKSLKNAKAVWVANRNGLFINIAASIAEAKGYTHIIIGANIEEGAAFKDNTKEFIEAENRALEYSVNSAVEVIAPMTDKNKTQIVETGIKLNVPFKYIYSCYQNNEKHCGVCESCLRLKRALELNNRNDIIKELF